MLKAPRRKRKGKIEIFIKEKKAGKRKPRNYWRAKRPIGKKRKISKKIYPFKLIQDQYGHILGYKSVKRK